MGISLTLWRVVGLAGLILALVAAPLRVSAGPAAAPPAPCAPMAMHHDPGCGDQGMMNADCLALCMAALPAAEAPAVAEPASYAVRYRDADVVRVGLTHRPEPPPPR